MENSDFNANNVFNAHEQHFHSVVNGRAPGSRLSLPDPLSRFTGRVRDLEALHKNLAAGNGTALSQLSLSAQGGVGKSVLAIEYAWRSVQHYPGGRYYVTAEAASPTAELARLAPAVGVQAGQSDPDTAAEVRATIEGFGKPSLLIIDNIADAAAWRNWSKQLPGGPCRRIVTTREQNLPDLIMQPLGRMTETECVELLHRFRPDATADESVQAVGAIVDWLDGWSVLVAMVGAYMELEPETTWAGYWAHLESRGLDSLRAIREKAQPHIGDYDTHIDVLLEDMLSKLDAVERRLVEYASLLPEDMVPQSWLHTLVQQEIDTGDVQPIEIPGGVDPFQRAFGRLKRFDLLLPRNAAGDGHLLSLHRVIRERVRERLDAHKH